MRITLLALGTRGDVQPAIALALGLRDAGHDVTIHAGHDFADWIRAYGLRCAPNAVSVTALMRSPDGLRWMANGTNKRLEARFMQKLMQQHGAALAEGMWEASQDAEAIISGFVSLPFAFALEDALGIPHITAVLQPLMPTRSRTGFASPFITSHDTILNRWYARFGLWATWQFVFGRQANQFRQRLDLPTMGPGTFVRRVEAVPMINGFSDVIVPRPDDWPAHVQVAGYWRLPQDADWEAPPALRRFLAEGPRPIAIGFGSMAAPDPEGTQQLILEGVRLAGARAVVLSGWSGMADAAPHADVLVLDSAPHDWLYPRMAAVVHHGGAGTTSAAFHAGVPQFVVPHISDQPYWGQRTVALGVGPHPVARTALTAGGLAAAIRQMVGNQTMAANAQAIAAQLAGEDGVARAVAFINAHLA
jgi:sterol 3beta-glucosyltransferase